MARRKWSTEGINPSLLDVSGHIEDAPVLPGMDGLPYRGPVQLFKDKDPNHKRPQRCGQAHVDVLELWDEVDRKRYEEICQLFVNGFAQLSREDLQYVPAKKGWIAFVRWIEYFMAPPNGGRR